MTTEDDKRLVARAVDDVINRGRLDAIEEFWSPEAAPAERGWITPFRLAFPDVRMRTVELVAEGGTVVGHFRCSGTHSGPCAGRPPTGRSFRDVREVYWFTVRGGRIADWWGLEDDDDRRRPLSTRER